MIDDAHERAVALDGAAYQLGQLAARMHRDAGTLLKASAALLSGEQECTAVAAVLRRYAEDGHKLCASEVIEVVHLIEGTLSPGQERGPRAEPALEEAHGSGEEIDCRALLQEAERQPDGRTWGDAMMWAVQLSDALRAAIRKARTARLEDDEKKYLFRLATSTDGALVRWRFLQPARQRATGRAGSPDARGGNIVPLFDGA